MSFLGEQRTRRLPKLLLGALALAVACWLAATGYGLWRLERARAWLRDAGVGEVATSAPPEPATRANAAPKVDLGDEAAREWLDDLSRRGPDRWNAAETARIAGFVAANAASVEALALAADELAASPAELLEPLRAARVLQLSAGLAVAEGRVAVGVEPARRCAELAGRLESSSTALDLIIGSRVEVHCLEAIAWLLKAGLADRSALMGLVHALPSEPPRAVVSRMLATEAAAMDAAAAETKGSRFERALFGWQHALRRARLLDGFREYSRLAQRPHSDFREALGSVERDTETYEGIILALTLPNFNDAIGKLKATAASRQLAERALVMRLEALAAGSYPPLCCMGADPLAGGVPTLEISSEGAVRLSNDAARRAFDEIWPHLEAGKRPRFTWWLPPLPSAVRGSGLRAS